MRRSFISAHAAAIMAAMATPSTVARLEGETVERRSEPEASVPPQAYRPPYDPPLRASPGSGTRRAYERQWGEREAKRARIEAALAARAALPASTPGAIKPKRRGF